MRIDMIQFGQRVRDRRKRLKLPQADVPNGPSSTYLSEIERGVMDPVSEETAEKLAAGLRWDLKTLRQVLRGDRPVEDLPIDSEPGSLPAPREVTTGNYDAEVAAARASFERARLDLKAAEERLDYFLRRQAAAALREDRLRDAAMRRERTLSRSLTPLERLALDVPQPSEQEVAQLVGLLATMHPGVMTAWESEQYETHLAVEASVGRVYDWQGRKDEGAELSHPDESLAAAALETEQGLDESPGGSDID